MSVVTVSTDLVTINCSCGGVYAITVRHHDDARQKGTCWTCPYCATQWGFSGRGENAQLKRELEEERNRLARERASHDQTRAALESKERARRAAVGLTTKIKNRVRAGLCPFCRRNFVALGAHIRAQHPGEHAENTA